MQADRKKDVNDYSRFEKVGLDSDEESKNNGDTPLKLEEALVNAGRLKDEGNGLFKKEQYEAAEALYWDGIRVLKHFRMKPSGVSDSQATEMKNLLISLYGNISQIYIKTEQWNKAISTAGVVLQYEPSNIKALYRRGLSSFRVNHFEEAKNDLLKVLEFDPQNAAAKKELGEVIKSLKDLRLKEKQAYSSMFGELGYDHSEKSEKWNVNSAIIHIVRDMIAQTQGAKLSDSQLKSAWKSVSKSLNAKVEMYGKSVQPDDLQSALMLFTSEILSNEKSYNLFRTAYETERVNYINNNEQIKDQGTEPAGTSKSSRKKKKRANQKLRQAQISQELAKNQENTTEDSEDEDNIQELLTQVGGSMVGDKIPITEPMMMKLNVMVENRELSCSEYELGDKLAVDMQARLSLLSSICAPYNPFSSDEVVGIFQALPKEGSKIHNFVENNSVIRAKATRINTFKSHICIRVYGKQKSVQPVSKMIKQGGLTDFYVKVHGEISVEITCIPWIFGSQNGGVESEGNTVCQELLPTLVSSADVKTELKPPPLQYKFSAPSVPPDEVKIHRKSNPGVVITTGSLEYIIDKDWCRRPNFSVTEKGFSVPKNMNSDNVLLCINKMKDMLLSELRNFSRLED